MAVSPARAAAFEILLRVERQQSHASELLYSARFAKLSSADHGLATQIVMGALRWRSLLDEHLAVASSQTLNRLDEEVLAALRLGAYQLHFLSRVPARAAIFESVELVKAARKRSAAAFVNAVLRKLTAAPFVRRSSAGSPAQSAAEGVFVEIHESANSVELARHAAHPEWLVKRWADRYGFERARELCTYNQNAPATAIQVYDNQCAEELAQSGVSLGPGRLLSSARVVLSGDVTQTRAYRQGRLTIQDEASQLVALLVGRGCRILDCCAAPGGKTALLASRNPGATVVASELHPRRARLLRKLAGHANVRVVAADARQPPFSSHFDRILVDVPCSGTGTLARNPEIKWRLTTADLSDLQTRQIGILQSALAQLAPRGRLVYSTCSLEREENETVVEAALQGASEFVVADCRGELDQLRRAGQLSDALGASGIESLVSGPYLRTIPGVHPGDGFFAAIIEKKTKRKIGS